MTQADRRPEAVVEALLLPEDPRGATRLACWAVAVGLHGDDELRASQMPGRADLVS